MKKFLYIWLCIPHFAGLLFFSSSLLAQNLVPNFSFEQMDSCPTGNSQINYATGWKSFANSPDYFDSCSTDAWYSVPNNYFGFKPAANGNAYAGIFAIVSSVPNLREFIGTQLSSPLIIGNTYYVSFKVNLCLRTWDDWVNTATNGLGILFSTIPYSITNPLSPQNFAHVYSTSVITDTLNWTTIDSFFVADSAYSYLILGNHFDDANINTVSFDTTPPNSYYLVDGVMVMDSLTSVGNYLSANYFNIFPNLFSSVTTLKIKTSINFKNAELKIFNSIGKEVKQKIIYSEETTIDRDNLPQGIYLVKILINDRIFFQKIIITN